MESEGTPMPYIHNEMSDAYFHASLTINIRPKNNIEFAWASRFIQLTYLLHGAESFLRS